ncbi:transposase, Ptta/En/Spm, plant [Spatholobus suberectus]|nr:transposase, Ptta/En/Spm, plant [Spatholobus suberectus]
MKNNLNKARDSMNKLNWVGESAWDRLCKHWASKEFKKKSITTKENWASDCGSFEGFLYTGGSIATSQHRYNMTKLTGIPPTTSELFRRTHQHKDKSWMDRRSEQINVPNDHAYYIVDNEMDNKEIEIDHDEDSFRRRRRMLYFL